MTRLTWFRAIAGQSALLCGLLVCACHGEIESEPNDTDESLEALTPVTVTFRTELTGQYLCADQGGGATVSADRTAPQAWETFKLLDLNDGALESNDLVYIEAQNGSYLQAAAGGGAALHAGSKNQLDWELFRVVKRQGNGRINNGDIVGLQTLSGFWVSAQNGGGGMVDAHARAFDAWEAFRIGLGNDDGGNGMRLVWSDEFDGPNIDERKWAYEVQRPGWVNHELQNYTYRRQENARIENGQLVIEGRRDSFNGHEYSSARLKTQGKASWRYGRMEARVQVPGGWGTWPALWMMPDDFSRGWPACGEIDILEHVGHDPNRVHATLHSAAYNWQRAEQRTSSTFVAGATAGFHIYALEWRAERIDMFVDGNLYFSMQNPNRGNDHWPFDKNFYVILNLAIGGDWGGARGVDPNIWPQRMLVDYVRVYQW